MPFRYQGQYEDGETGLYYNRFRYFSPETGGYISQDPIRLKGNFSLYSYVKNTNAGIDVLGLIEQARGNDGKFLPKNPGDTPPGSDAVDEIRAKYDSDTGYRVLGEEITFKDSHEMDGTIVEQTRRYDLVVQEIETGKVIGVEVKSSETASYNSKQRGFDNRVNSGFSNAKPAGAKAADAGIKKIDEVKVERLCT